MTTLKKYLEDKAKFHTPPTEGVNQSSSDINDIEAESLDDEWKPVAARCDTQMVNSLLRKLDEYLGERPLPVNQALLDSLFQPIVDRDGERAYWADPNSDEHVARRMVSAGHITALMDILAFLGTKIKWKHKFKPPDQNIIKSLVDHVLYPADDPSKKMLIEIKAPSVLEHALTKLQSRTFRLYLRSRSPSNEKVINKVCLYMAANKVRWTALTSQNKWVFLRLHPGDDPFVSFSTVEMQEGSSRPFRALLATMLATIFDLDIESHVDMSPLPDIREEDENPNKYNPPGLDLNEDKSGTFRGSGKSTREDRPSTRFGGVGGQNVQAEATEEPDLLVCWSPAVKKNPKSFAFYEVGRTSQDIILGSATPHLYLERAIGGGLTGAVYEANLALDPFHKSTNSGSYAVKVVVKGSHEERMGNIGQLREEFAIYCKIERAIRTSKIPSHVVPRCYGLYESNSMLALITDYEGKSLTDKDWKVLSYREKAQIFGSVAALHKIGIGHYDFEPRNIVRDSAGSFKIIDFALAATHDCPGIKELSWYKEQGHSECAELRSIWDQLGIEPRFLLDSTRAESY